MLSRTEELRSAPKSQWMCSIFWLMPLVLVFGVLLVVGAFALMNWALPEEDAKLLKNLFAVTIGGSTGGVALTGAIGFVQRSLRLTEAKLQAFQMQSEQQASNNWSPIDRSSTEPSSTEPSYPSSDVTEFSNADELSGVDADEELSESEELSEPRAAFDLVFHDMIPRGQVKDSE